MQDNKTYVIGGFGGSHFQIFFVFHLKNEKYASLQGSTAIPILMLYIMPLDIPLNNSSLLYSAKNR